MGRKGEALPIWLTVAEAADIMRLGRNKLYQLIAEGVVPHRRLGRSIHIHRDVAERWTPDLVEPHGFTNEAERRGGAPRSVSSVRK